MSRRRSKGKERRAAKRAANQIRAKEQSRIQRMEKAARAQAVAWVDALNRAPFRVRFKMGCRLIVGRL